MEIIRNELPANIPSAKLMPPVSPQAEVARLAFCDRSAANGMRARLIVVQAPAGFGKTTSMHQLCKRLCQGGIKSAWLTLDHADNDASRFLHCLNASFAAAGICSSPPASVFDLDHLLSCCTAPFALFLDEFENIHEPAVFALVKTIIASLPRGAQVIVGSRNQPTLGLAKLRAQGQLLELDADVLRFTESETRQYLRLRHQQALSAEAISSLHVKTEGWITALWLASISIERSGSSDAVVSDFSGTTREVADYLVEDVLDRQTSEIRRFLLKTSILRDIDQPLCQALMPELDVESVLKSVTDQNLFLVSPAKQGNSYRYHSLFANFLRARLGREYPGEQKRLHLSAAQWYASHHRLVPAIEHAIVGDEITLVLELLGKAAKSLLEAGRMRLLSRWFNAIPEDALKNVPMLRAARIWSRLFTEGPLSVARELKRPDYTDHLDPELQAHLNAQRPVLLAMEDRYDEALAVGQASLASLPTCNAFADSVLSNAMADVLIVMGKSQQAQLLIDDARRTHGESIFNRMYAESLEGVLDLQAGRLRQATARFRMALSSTSPARINYTQGNAWAGLLYAEALYEANEFAAAEQLINSYLPLICDIGLPDQMCTGHIIMARIAFCRGEVGESFEVLGALEHLGHHRGLPRLVANAKLERSKFLLLRGNAHAAKDELNRADDAALWSRIGRQRLPANELDYMELARHRWEIHFGDPRAVLPLIDRDIAEATAQFRYRRALKLRVLRCLALQRSGDFASATEAIAAVVREAVPEGFLRLIADEGEEVGRVAQQFNAVLEEMPARQSDPILMEYLQRLIAVFGAIAGEGQDSSMPITLMEPLTRKEIYVLQLTADGCSNGVMVEKLGLSDSTVRTHLRNINSKLNTHSRSEAVAVARRIGIIR
ncbi:LuxR C-terminal-related transcriptional regulator [Massilia cavernae]|uniref:Helix-turn-helix transcriptional regulator n=1 Tax=Massilia cavernae TaxID=2320864 RepID=A0A418XFW3_9BURK|nr:LuxR C-terminal-related transcriptional regulator [Massilia cavernae]RJG11350.1 helix-turn-helix transcriptional regulator [Massilia cavernae]